MITKGFKLFRLRADGSLGPLFINRKLRIPLHQWMPAEAHRTKGFAYRPGWHATPIKHAPHLTTKGRVWCEVELKGCKPFKKPESQGGTWLLAEHLKVVRILPPEKPAGALAHTNYGLRIVHRAWCEKCNTLTNWVVEVGGRWAHWCGCGN